MTHALAEWIRDAHAALAEHSSELQSASWGPVGMRHRTVRPHWYSPLDRAWAQPIDRGADLDIVSAAFQDVPPSVGPPPVDPAELGVRGDVPLPAECPLRMTYTRYNGEALAWDPDSGLAVVLREAPPDGYDLVSPLRYLVHWVTVANGGILVHGAVVGRADNTGVPGLLLLGEAGFGKSTTTLACLAHGWLTCGDDAVAVYGQDGRWTASAIYAAVKTKLAAQAPPDLPDLGSAVMRWDVAGTKRAHLLSSTDEQTLTPTIELRAVVLLDPTAQPSAPVTQVSPASMRTRAAVSTLILIPYEGQAILRRFGVMSAELPSLRLPRRPLMAQTVADLSAILDDAVLAGTR